MEFTPEETKKIKTMLLFLVKKKHNESGGHCGFGILELLPFLRELEQENKIQTRPTIHDNKYFLTNNNSNNGE